MVSWRVVTNFPAFYFLPLIEMREVESIDENKRKADLWESYQLAWDKKKKIEKRDREQQSKRIVSLYYQWKSEEIYLEPWYTGFLIDGKKWFCDLHSYEFEQSKSLFPTIEESIDGYLEWFFHYHIYWNTMEGREGILDDSVVLNINMKGDENVSWEPIDFLLMNIFGKMYVIEKAELQGKTGPQVKTFMHNVVKKAIYSHIYSKLSLSKIMVTQEKELLTLLESEHKFSIWEFQGLLRNLYPVMLVSLKQEVSPAVYKTIEKVLLAAALYTYYSNEHFFPKDCSVEKDIFQTFTYLPTGITTDEPSIENMIERLYEDESFAYYGRSVYTDELKRWLEPITGEPIGEDICPDFAYVVHMIQLYREKEQNKATEKTINK